MKLSTRGRYGLRAMLELARHEGSQPLLLDAIAERQDLSKKYLHAILSRLKAAGFVRSVRGAGGGFVLAQDPADIRLDGLVRVLEGSLAVVDCVEDASVCEKGGDCTVREVWQGLTEALESYLAGKTLADLVDRQAEKDGEGRMYFI